MDSWTRSKEVEKPKAAKLRAQEEADFLNALARCGDQSVSTVLLSRKRLESVASLLHELGGGKAATRA